MTNEIHQTIVVHAGKSAWLAAVLTFFFGPLGMFYSTVWGAIIMFILYIIVGVITVGFGLIVLHPIAIIWAAIAASNSSKKLIKQ